MPGFARVESVSITILFMDMGISFITACKNDFWENCGREKSFAGVSIEVGVTFPGGFDVSRSTTFEYASDIEIEKDAPVDFSQCPAQKWEAYIGSLYSKGNTEDAISVHYFGNKDEFDRAKENRNFGTPVAMGCGHKLTSGGGVNTATYRMELEYRPYAIQVVNWGDDDLFIDFLKLTRGEVFPGSGKREKYQWGAPGGKGWVISTNSNDSNNWEGKTNQDRAYNSFTFRVDDDGYGVGWDVSSGSCRQNNDGFCDQLQMTYHLQIDATHGDVSGEHSNDGIEVYVDGELKRECLDCDSCLTLYLYLTKFMMQLLLHRHFQ